MYRVQSRGLAGQMATKPEALARQQIDAALEDAGWRVQNFKAANLGAGRGVAIREFSLKRGHGFADYLLYLDRKAVGAVEAKKAGDTLTGVEIQSAKYGDGLPTGLLAWVRPLPFLYESTGIETRFTNRLDPEPRSREVFHFHRPEMLAEWAQAAGGGAGGAATRPHDGRRCRRRWGWGRHSQTLRGGGMMRRDHAWSRARPLSQAAICAERHCRHGARQHPGPADWVEYAWVSAWQFRRPLRGGIERRSAFPLDDTPQDQILATSHDPGLGGTGTSSPDASRGGSNRMRTPNWLVIVPLFVVVWLMGMLASGWPGAVAHATEGQRRWDAGHTVALNEQDDNSDDDDEADDDDDKADDDNDEADDDNDEADDDNDEADDDNDDDDDDDDDADDNDNRDDVTVVPIVVPVSAPAPAGPSVSMVDEVSQCLANGGILSYQGPNAGIAVTSFQDNLNVTLTRVNPTAQPAPPGLLVGSDLFRLSASPCGGSPYSVLPMEVNLAVSYSDALAAGRDESRFALMFYDGTTWTVAPKLYRDPASNHVSASVTGLGIYALVQQP
jgi:hypothetical protein